MLSAFGLACFLLRKKKLWIRAAVGLALSALAIFLLLTLLILGGDPAPPGSIPYTPGDKATAEQDGGGQTSLKLTSKSGL